ncbi:ThuA domain-containing protein [Paenibacillus sp. TRM 82003]|uniref:ThuA domain-containing protein n=1 Tax=Kineococcus sp. TRM81007 TaxID=2925831 RepID=UPI001F56E5DC|nr:ThuA domain-containing protein [Kineococcus sp. TRM81007]MCI2236906.1 ThuA domain-containing protein [Kineococcus sp. TRM81007]MCI3921898.1 ThuA domain-containing protein [Paenibacillus sp. TRM 82003]
MSGAERSLRVLVWNEGVHEANRNPPDIGEYYPDGIHGAIAAGLRRLLPDAEVTTATLADPEHGLTEQVLERTDVVLWWGHAAHEQVDDAVVDRVRRHVLGGMGLLVLHSGHYSKIFTRLMGTTCSLAWRNEGERELVWNVKPSHPIARGIPSPIVIERQEMYGELFDIPDPDDLLFISSFAGGEVFRSGVTFTRGRGRIFYFSPGDQEYPVYHHPQVQQVLANGVRWAAPDEPVRDVPDVGNPSREWFAAG